MTNLPLEPDSQDNIIDRSNDAETGSVSDLAPGVPRWVYAIGIIALIIVGTIIILHLTGGGFGGHLR